MGVVTAEEQITTTTAKIGYGEVAVNIKCRAERIPRGALEVHVTGHVQIACLRNRIGVVRGDSDLGDRTDE
ncbi:hypothetical protein Pla22_28780 [Rubripirellula amarantea]|uniref:Uncharacterized protein n=1 Tax=Rubripirellula amarantea TaxID=2527999 RepID=A0A5C5WH78_9BACT|nr:hypothetical protein Pla22_28780 [Rubripirellula amarantea]